MTVIQLNGKKIGFREQVFLIAEAGVNHNGSLEIAKEMIDLAAETKVDAIKFQTFVTEKMILKSTPKAQYQKTAREDKENFYDMLKKYEFSLEDFKILRDHCSKRGIIFLSTPFDNTSVEWLEELKVPVYKISSGDMDNFPLLSIICTKNKPILLSTGMATLSEVRESVEFINSKEINEIVLFQCTTNYPASYEDLNLNVIDTYKKEFPNVILGFSDHSIGIEASLAAVGKGAKVVEKHFTLDKKMEGPDHKASMNPTELAKWVESVRIVELALGSSEKLPAKSELEISKIAKKSIVAKRDLKKGDILKKEDLAIKRPGYGISPKEYYNMIGKIVKNEIFSDTIIKWEDLE